MRRLRRILSLLLILLFFCAPALGEELGEELKSYDGKRIGVLTGSIFDQMMQDIYPNAKLSYYSNYADQLLALKGGKIDAFPSDEPLARVLISANDGVRIAEGQIAPDEYAFAYAMDRAELCEAVGACVDEYWQDGTLKKLDEKWFGANEDAKTLEELSFSGEKGVIRLATDGQNAPFSYLKDGQIVGYEIDLARIVAARLGYTIEVSSMDFAAIIPSLVSGKCDMAASCISVTEERKKSVLFSTPDYYGGVVMITLAQSAAAAAPAGPFAGFVKGFNSTFVEEGRWALLLEGLGTTLLISFFAAAIGTLLGALVCAMKRSRSRASVKIADGFVRVMQGTPVLVVLMILNFVVFGSVNINPIPVAILGFALNMAAYVSEMLQAAIDAVDKGQVEAATASGFTRLESYRFIVLPQAVRHALPVYKGEIISLVKNTSIVGYISIMDLTRMSDLIRSRTYEAFFPLIATAIVYFLIATVLVKLLERLQLRIDPKRRARVVKGVSM